MRYTLDNSHAKAAFNPELDAIPTYAAGTEEASPQMRELLTKNLTAESILSERSVKKKTNPDRRGEIIPSIFRPMRQPGALTAPGLVQYLR